MNILMVSSYLPYPLFDGGSVRLYNIIKELSKKHKITLVCEIRQKQSQSDIAEVEKYCEEVIVIPHKKPWSFPNILKTIFSINPLLVTMHTFPHMKRRIVELLNVKRFDVIHVETFYVYQNLPKTYLPIVVVEHNVEYLVYARYAQTAKLYLRPLLFIDIFKIKKYEEKVWRKATKLCAVTDEEKRTMQMIRNDVVTVPNGVDIHTYTPMKQKERKTKKVLFIGSFKWVQNIITAEWIINDIWPKIIEEIKIKKIDIKPVLWIVGKDIPESLKNLPTDAITFDENAPDATWKIYREADILLAPIKVGGGSSYKILESMASGVPVVTTSLAANALEARRDKEIVVAEETDELAHSVVNLLQNPELYGKIRKNARELIEKQYNWEVIAEKLDYVYKSAVS